MPQGLADYYKQMQKDWEDALKRLDKKKPKPTPTKKSTPTPTPTPTKRMGGEHDHPKPRPMPTRAPAPRRAVRTGTPKSSPTPTPKQKTDRLPPSQFHAGYRVNTTEGKPSNRAWGSLALGGMPKEPEKKKIEAWKPHAGYRAPKSSIAVRGKKK